MRKLIWLFTVLMAFSLSALAQHGHGGGPRGGNGPRGGRNEGEHQQHVRENHDAYRGRGRADVREHGDGRRFDRDYFHGRWGADHRFYWRHCRWYGPRFYVGSRFYYSGAWFVVVDPIPDYWGDDVIYVDDIDGVYYVVNPLYPGIYIHVNIY